jgi:hypothetical protein
MPAPPFLFLLAVDTEGRFGYRLQPFRFDLLAAPPASPPARSRPFRGRAGPSARIKGGIRSSGEVGLQGVLPEHLVVSLGQVDVVHVPQSGMNRP